MTDPDLHALLPDVANEPRRLTTTAAIVLAVAVSLTHPMGRLRVAGGDVVSKHVGKHDSGETSTSPKSGHGGRHSADPPTTPRTRRREASRPAGRTEGRREVMADPRPGPGRPPTGPTHPTPTHPPSMPPPAPVPAKTSIAVPARSVALVEAASMRRHAGTPARAGDPWGGDLARAGTQTPVVVVGSGGGGFQPTPKGSM